MLNRLYILLSLLALGWVAFVGWDIYIDWDRYPEDRGITVFIGAFPLIVLAALNYLLYGRECLHSSITLRVANLGQGWVEMGMDRNSYREMAKPLLAIILLL